MFSKIFSIVNPKNNNHYIVTICGLKIKFKKNMILDRKDYKNFVLHHIKDKSVLLVELNTYHGECLPGIAKYFVDLGYNVDVLLNRKEYELNPFSNNQNKKISIYPASPEKIKSILCSNIIEPYDYLYINSDRFKYDYNPIHKYLGNGVKFPSNKTIIMCHMVDMYADINSNNKNVQIVTLADFPILKGCDYKRVNAHYFKKTEYHTKNKTTKFIVVGNIHSYRKNHSNLIETVKKLDKEGCTNFKIVVISRTGSLDIPPEIAHYFECTGTLPYDKMYKEIEQADFLLTLFDPDNIEHDRYITSGASGSYQLIYGFNIPALIPYKFQTEVNGLNNLNSIGYKDNADLINAMKFCINMRGNKYNLYKNKLSVLEKSIYKESLDNLKKIIHIH